MANTVKVTVDGMEREITLPDYALEATQEKILKALTKGDKTDKESKSALDELVKGAGRKAKDDKKAQSEADKDRNAQLDALKNINKNVKETGGTGSNLNKFGSAVKSTAKEVFNFGATVLTGVSTAITSLFVQANSLGNEFGKLQMSGVGLDTAGMSAINLSTSLNALGFTTDQALSILGEYSGVVQTVGRQAFLDVNKQFLQITGSGTKLGLTLDQAADVLAEDLELRKTLGIIQDISTNKQAKLSAKLFEQQLQATTVLGKSIDDIRGAAKSALEDNERAQLSILAITAGMDPDAAAEFTNGLQKAAGDMAAVGVDQRVIDGVFDAALAPVAFMGEQGKSLNKALTALDAAAGSSLRAQVQAANAAKQRGDMDEFNRIMNNFDDEMMKAAAALDQKDLEQLMIQLPELGGVSKDLALSLGQLRLASQNAADAQNASVSALTKSARAFDNAQNQISASFNMAMNNVSGALGAPMEALAEAFSDEVVRRNEFGQILDKDGKVMRKAADQFNEAGEKIGVTYTPIKNLADLTEEQAKSVAKTNGIFGTFRNAMDKINEAFRKLFDPIEDGSKGIGNLATIIADKVNPYIEKFGNYVAKFIGSITAEDIEATIDGVVLALTGLWEGLKVAASVIKSVVGFFVDVDEEQVAVKDKDGNPVLNADGTQMMKTVASVDIAQTIIQGFAGLFALNMLKKGVTAVISKGIGNIFSGGKGGGGALASATDKAGGAAGGGLAKTLGGAGTGVQKFAEGIGKGVEALGKGLGNAISALLKGVGGGLSAIANPAALAGLAAISAAILAISAALRIAEPAFVSIGEMIRSTFEGMAPLVESFGAAIESTLTGMSVFVEGVGASIANVVTSITDGIASIKTAGAEAESIKLEAQTAAMERLSAIPTENILATADAVSMLAGSMTAFGDAVGDDGFMGVGADGADVNKQNEQIGVFAKFAGLDSVAIISTSDALNMMADSYSKFASLDADKLMAVSTAMEEINKASSPDVLDNAKQFVDNTLGSVANRLGFGSDDVNQPAPDTQAVAQAITDAEQAGSGQPMPEGLTKDALALLSKLDQVKDAIAGPIKAQTKQQARS